MRKKGGKCKVKRICLLLLVLLCFNFSGCSILGNDKKGYYRKDGYDEGEEVVTMWVHVIQDTPEGEAYAQSVKEFNEKFDGKYYLDVEFVPRNESGGGYSDKVNASVISGGLPDIITVDGPNVSSYAANNIIQPLAEITQDELDEYLPSMIEQGTVNGKLYSLGVMESSVGFYYNKDIIKELGIEIPPMDDPWTWSELLEVCRKAKNYFDNGYVIDMPFPTGETTIYFYAPFIWSNGGDFVSEDGLKVNGIFNSKKNEEPLNYFKTLIDKGYVSKVDIEDLFESGRAAFLFDGAWTVNRVTENFHDINLGIAPYPVGESWNGERYTPTGGWAFSVTSACKNVEAATEAVKYMSGVKSGITMYEKTGNLPSTYGAYEQIPVFQEEGLFKQLYEQLETYGHPRPKSPVYPQISTSFQQAVEGVLLNDETPKDSLYKTMRRIEDRLLRYQN